MNSTPTTHYGSVYGHPSVSFTTSPQAGQADPHLAHVNSEVASVASVASDLLQQVVKEELDIVSDPNADPQEVARARARILSAVSVVHSASNAVTGVAEAEAAHAGLVSTDTLDEFKESSPGARDSNSDRLADFLNVQFNTARDNMLDAASGMENDPALPGVLSRRGQPGGVAGFFKRVSAAAVALGALGARALAVPGMVRKAVVNGLERADNAVIDAFDRWHTKFGQAVDGLRDEVGARIDSAVNTTQKAVQDASGWTRDRAADVVGAANRGIDEVKHFADENIARPMVQGIAAIEALDKVASQRISDGVSKFFKERVSPAIQRFSQDLDAEMEARIPEKYKRSTISRSNFDYNKDAHAHMDPDPELRESRGVKGP